VPATLLIDGDCGFCRRSAGWLIAWRCQVDVVAWQRYPLDTIPLSSDEADRMVHLVDGAQLWAGHHAIAECLQRSASSPVRTIGRVIGAPALRWWWSRAYRAVAATRHRLPGGTPTCRLE
jgi:predicted DCC family thiol-disulfide oxidoreductase YuxK